MTVQRLSRYSDDTALLFNFPNDALCPVLIRFGLKGRRPPAVSGGRTDGVESWHIGGMNLTDVDYWLFTLSDLAIGQRGRVAVVMGPRLEDSSPDLFSWKVDDVAPLDGSSVHFHFGLGTLMPCTVQRPGNDARIVIEWVSSGCGGATGRV